MRRPRGSLWRANVAKIRGILPRLSRLAPHGR